jgi:hypothetical protein
MEGRRLRRVAIHLDHSEAILYRLLQGVAMVVIGWQTNLTTQWASPVERENHEESYENVVGGGK